MLGLARAWAPDWAGTSRCRGVGFSRRPVASAMEGLSPSPRRGHSPSSVYRNGALRREFSALRGGNGGHPLAHGDAPEPNKRLLQAAGIAGAARRVCFGCCAGAGRAGRWERGRGRAGGAPRLPHPRICAGRDQTVHYSCPCQYSHTGNIQTDLPGNSKEIFMTLPLMRDGKSALASIWYLYGLCMYL